jgi:hypothetical protein
MSFDPNSRKLLQFPQPGTLYLDLGVPLLRGIALHITKSRTPLFSVRLRQRSCRPHGSLRPMAITIMGGLLVASGFTVLAVPALYAM